MLCFWVGWGNFFLFFRGGVMAPRVTFLAKCNCGRVLVQEKDSIYLEYWTKEIGFSEVDLNRDIAVIKCPNCFGDDSFHVRD